MTVVHALPSRGGVFFDVRDDGRTFRVGWHADQGMVVLSTWRHGSCVATCHLDRTDIPTLVNELVEGLAATPPQSWTEPTYVEFAAAAAKPRFGPRWPRLALRRVRRNRPGHE